MSGSMFDGIQQPQMMFNNPFVSSLAGAAGAVGQLAMPSRLPIPNGAVWAALAAGLGQGQQNAIAGQNQQQVLEAAQMANQFTRATLPAKMSLLQGIAGPGSAAGGAMGVPSGGGGQPGVGGQLGGTPGTGAGSGYLMDPNQQLGWARYAMATGQDRTGASLLQNLQSEAGGTGYAMGSNGGGFAVPGGSADINVIKADAGAKSAGSLPYDVMLDQAKAQFDQQTHQTNAQTDLTYAGPTAAAGASAKAPYGAPVTFTGPGPDGKTREFTVPAANWYASGGGGGVGGAPDPTAAPPPSAAPSGTISANDYATRVAGGEAGTGSGSATAFNQSGPGGAPTSTAMGGAQFTGGTWLGLFKQAFPQQSQQFNAQQILSLRTDNDWTKAMTVKLAQQNAPILQAGGITPTAQSLAVAHAVGAPAAVKVMQAPVNMPMSQILSQQAIAANPTWASQTAGQFRTGYGMRVGYAPVDFGGGAPAGAPPGAPTPLTIPGAIPGKIVMTPEQTATSDAYGDQQKAIITAAGNAPKAMQQLDILAGAAQGFRPGATGTERLEATKAMVDGLQSVGISPPSWMVNGTTAGETIQKEGMQLATAMTRTLGSREPGMVLQMITKVMPNVELSQGGYQVIVSGLRQTVQRDQDLDNFRQQYVKSNGSWEGGEAAFDKANPPEAYASRVVALPPPASADKAIPNVIYRTPKGPMLWTGNGFVSAQSPGQAPAPQQQAMNTPQPSSVPNPNIDGPGGPQVTPAVGPAPPPQGMASAPQVPTMQQMQMLKANPGTAAQFDQQFGPGSSQRVLSQ